ncbi:MAG: RIP metalloprotease RseP [Bacteroidales bacterium]|nr:RIP metalloprotease RseP [Bacteroidales bacterium]
MKILALLVSLSFLVIIHEFGHYCFARLFKTRVEKFYLFFNPYFSLLRAKRYNGKWHFSFFSKESPEEFSQYPDNTEWGIGWLPFGGYCSIAGMVDETHTSAQALKQEPQPWEYRSKKAWQRLLIVAGGVIVNFVAALVIYSLIMFVWGTEHLPVQNTPYGYDYNQTALKYGFRNGDKILSVEGKDVWELKNAVNEILLNEGRNITVERQGKKENIVLPKGFAKEMIGNGEKSFAIVRVPFVVGGFADNSVAKQNGMKEGDSIVSLNGKQIFSFSEFAAAVTKYAGQTVNIDYYRDNALHSVSMKLGQEGKIGAYCKDFSLEFKTIHRSYGFFESVPKGISQGINTLVSYVKQFKFVFSKEGATQVGGFGAIGNLFPSSWDWQIFWNMTAFLSIILAFMNILPIPALDGGYVLFTLWEIVTGRKPSDKFMERAQMVGMILLFALLIYANGNDLVRWLTGKF